MEGRQPAPQPDQAGRPLDVVLVDDAESFRFLLRHMLRRDARFRVVGEAENGVEAIELAGALRPDFMLLDLKMPVMGGEEALPRVLEASPRTRVVVVSGLEADLMEKRVRGLGAVAYFEKDGSFVDLGERLLALGPPP